MMFIFHFLLTVFLCSCDPFQVLSPRIDNQDPNSFVKWDLSEHKFSWKTSCLSSNEKYRNSRQYQFEIKIVDDTTKTLVFDSGIVKGNVTFHYVSQKLLPSTRYMFTIRVWVDMFGQEPIQSEEVVFHTSPDDSYWKKAEWISGRNIFRTEFSIPSKVQDIERVYLFITGLGYYNAFINGGQVVDSIGTRLLDPAWTNFNKTVLFSGYDVTSFFNPSNYSEFAVAVEIGNGWYLTPGYYYGTNATKCLKLVLQVFFKKDGRDTEPDFILTSNVENWKTTQGPIIEDSVYNGETYDSRLLQKGWKKPGFKNGTAWTIPSNAKYPLGGDNLVLQQRPPIRDDEVFYPRSIHELGKTGEFIVDFGQNMAGVCEIVIHPSLKSGTEIVLVHAEVLKSDGSLYLDNLRSAKATDTFILQGTPGESYRPTFTVHGFRYVSVSGVTNTTMFSIRAIHFHTSVPKAGLVQFSNNNENNGKDDLRLMNQLQSCVRYGAQSNLMSIPTDCPQRDERLGWLADSFLSSEESSYNYDMESFYLDYLAQFLDEIHDGGELPDYVPFCTRFGTSQYHGDPTWTAAFLVLVKNMYYSYGDDKVVRTYYPYLRDYVSFLDGKVHGTNLSRFYNAKYGDWCPPKPRRETLKHYTASFYWIRTISTMKEFARLLGSSEDEKMYASLESYYRGEFKKAFYDKLFKLIGDDSQSAITMALILGVFDDDESLRKHFVDKLVNEIVEKESYHVTTGIVGIRFLFPLLTQMGYHDVAVGLITKTSYPSYGYMITNKVEPSTTLWEIWDAPTGSPNMDSRNHIMFGSIGGWFYSSVAGITSKSGYEHIRVRPSVTNQTMVGTTMNVSFDSPRGNVAVTTRVKSLEFCGMVDEGYHLDLTCPHSSSVIDEISFASFGAPVGRCGSFKIDEGCHAKNTMKVIESACLGKNRCFIEEVNENLFLTTACYNDDDGKNHQHTRNQQEKRLFLSGRCKPTQKKTSDDDDDVLLEMEVDIPVNSDSIICVPTKIVEGKDFEISESDVVVWKDGKLVQKTPGMINVWKSDTDDCIDFLVGSGHFFFKINIVK